MLVALSFSDSKNIMNINVQVRVIVVIIGVVIYSCSSSEKLNSNECGYLIRWKFISHAVSFDHEKISLPHADTIKKSDAFIILTIESCKGKAYFEKFSVSDSSLLLSGSYSDSKGLLANHFRSVDVITGEIGSVSYIKFYEVLKDGIWKYYNSKGVIEEKIIYEDGVVMDRIKFNELN